MIIHQIWIGKNIRPDVWMDSVRDFCNKYNHTYMLWNEKKLKTIDTSPFEGMDKLINSLTDYAGIADIYRLLLLHKYGGVYIDADIVILNDELFNDLITKKSNKVYFAYEDEHGLIANSVIGAPKGHNFIRHCLENITKNANTKENEPIWIRTGPRFVTDMYNATKELHKDIEVINKSDFYPVSWHGIKEIDQHKKTKIKSKSMLYQYGYSTNGFADKISVHHYSKNNDILSISLIISTIIILFLLAYIFKLKIFDHMKCLKHKRQ
jgi:mannosyltransferase OCH1-like enzyme